MPACLLSPLVLYPELHCADGAHRRTFVMKTANRSTANRCAGVNRSQWSRSAQKEREPEFAAGQEVSHYGNCVAFLRTLIAVH